jgi:hypothetical protein
LAASYVILHIYICTHFDFTFGFLKRQTLEERLSEARKQLSESRAGSNDRINTLGSLVSSIKCICSNDIKTISIICLNFWGSTFYKERLTGCFLLLKVSTLNERLERKETALTECKRMYELESASMKEKVGSYYMHTHFVTFTRA